MTQGDEQDGVRSRLVALPPGAGPAAGDPGSTSAGEDLLGQAVRRAEVALQAAATSYTAAHGSALEHPALVGPARARWLTGPRVALVAAVALVLLGTGVAARSIAQVPTVLVSAARAAPGPGVTAGPAQSGAPPSAGATADAGPGTVDPSVPGGGDPGRVVVHVVGAVARPGVVELAAGARVVEAIDAAGGPSPDADLEALNLARVLADGEQVVVPGPGTAPGPQVGGPPAAAGTLDLNTADLAELDALPGIGPVLAQRILDWRTRHGRFSTVDELGEVTGIGPSVLAGLRDLVHA